MNALSTRFIARSVRDGQMREAIFERGNLISDTTSSTNEENGTFIFFEPDNTLFLNYHFRPEFIETMLRNYTYLNTGTMLRNYTYLNTGLAIYYNGKRIISRNGLETDWRTY